MEPVDIVALARAYDAYEPVDGRGDTFRRQARILQSVWRVEQGYEALVEGGRRRGARLPMPWARDSLANYLTDTIHKVVKAEVLDPIKSEGKLYGKPRIFDHLLSSQPLCFNLFGELQRDLPLATAVLRDLSQGRTGEVTAIEFEHSPGRGDAAYLGDHSAFDVYVEYVPPGGGRGFVGIEVKYHEDLKGSPSPHKPRYDEVADMMGCFDAEARLRLRDMPLQQVWRDHLLAGITRQVDAFDDGFFVFLCPEANTDCAEAVTAYEGCLTRDDTFAPWGLGEFVETVRRHTTGDWIDLFADRYLAFEEVEAARRRRDPRLSSMPSDGPTP